MLNGISNVYIINMPKDKERLGKVLLETSKNGINDPIITSGVNVKIEIPSNLKKYSSIIYSPLLSTGALGCSLAHINAWEKMVENKDKCSLFLEDDITFEDDFKSKFNNYFPTVPKDFDLLYVSCFYGNYFSGKMPKIVKPLFETLFTARIVKYINNNIYIPERPVGMHSYVLSNKGAKYLLKYFKKHKVTDHIDQQILKPMLKKKSMR